MEIKKQLNTVLSKKMSRQDFLKHAAMGAVAVVGGGALLHLTSLKPGASEANVGSTANYGDAPYGGSQPRSGGRA